MAHTFRAVSQTSVTPATTNPLTHNHTPGARATVVILTIISSGTTARTGGAPTIGGIVATQFDSRRVGLEQAIEGWYVIGDFDGSVLACSVPNTGAIGLSYEVISADAGTGLTSALNNASGNANADDTGDGFSVNVTSLAVGDFLYGRLGCGENAPSSITQTSANPTKTVTNSNDHGAYSSRGDYANSDGAGTETFTYVWLNDDGCAVAACFKSESAINVFDTVNVSDYVEIFIPELNINVTDTVNVSDVPTIEPPYPVPDIDKSDVVDTAYVSESVTVQPYLEINVFDTANVSEFITVQTYLEINVFDNCFVSENISAEESAQQINIFDNITVEDVPTVQVVSIGEPDLNVNIYDIIEVTDLLLFIDVFGNKGNFDDETSLQYFTLVGATGAWYSSDIDGIGRINCMKITATRTEDVETNFNRCYIKKGARYKLTAKIYIPSSNTTGNQVKFRDYETFEEVIHTVTQLDQWVDINLVFIPQQEYYKPAVRLCDDGSYSGITVGDVFYLDNYSMSMVFPSVEIADNTLTIPLFVPEAEDLPNSTVGNADFNSTSLILPTTPNYVDSEELSFSTEKVHNGVYSYKFTEDGGMNSGVFNVFSTTGDRVDESWIRLYVYLPSDTMSFPFRANGFAVLGYTNMGHAFGVETDASGNIYRWWCEGQSLYTRSYGNHVSAGNDVPLDEWILVEVKYIDHGTSNPDSGTELYINGSLVCSDITAIQPNHNTSDFYWGLGCGYAFFDDTTYNSFYKHYTIYIDDAKHQKTNRIGAYQNTSSIVDNIIASEYGSNLVPSASSNFDTDGTAWWNDSGGGDAYHNWNASGFMHVWGEDVQLAKYNIISGSDLGKSYRVSFRAKGTTTRNLELRFHMGLPYTYPGTLTTEWKNFSGVVTALETSFVVLPDLVGAETFDIDDIVIEELLYDVDVETEINKYDDVEIADYTEIFEEELVGTDLNIDVYDTANVSDFSGNYVLNGTFNTSLTGWTSNGSPPTFEWVSSGGGFTGAAHLVINSYEQGFYTALDSGRFSIDLYSTYRLRANVNVISLGGLGFFTLRLQVSDSTYEIQINSTGLTLIDELIFVDNSHVQSYLFFFGGGLGSSECYVDNIILEKITPSVKITLEIAAIDDVNISDVVTIVQSDNEVNVVDNISVQDIINVDVETITPLNISIVDLIDISDNVEVAIQEVTTLEINVSDNAVVSDEVTISVQEATVLEIDIYDEGFISDFIISEFVAKIFTIDNINVEDFTEQFITDLFIDVYDNIQVEDYLDFDEATPYAEATDYVIVTDYVEILIPELLISVADNISVSDFIISDSYAEINISDTVNVSENIVLDNILEINITDLINCLENIITALSDIEINITDNISISDNITNDVTVEINSADTINVSEDIIIQIEEAGVLQVNISDYVYASESIITEFEFDINVIDNINTSDDITINSALSLSIIDNINVLDDIIITQDDLIINIIDNVSISDLIITESELETFIIDNIQVTDFIDSLITDLNIDIYDNVFVQDHIDFDESTPYVEGIDYVNVSDYVEVIISDLQIDSIIDNVNVSEDIIIQIEEAEILLINVSDFIYATDNITIQLSDLEINTVDEVLISDIVLSNLSDLEINLFDFIYTTDNINQLFDLEISIIDNVNVSDYIELLIEAVEELFINIIDNVNVSENIIGNIPELDVFTVTIDDTVNVSDYVEVLISELSINIYDIVNVLDDIITIIEETGSLSINIYDTVNVSDSIESSIGFAINIEDYVYISESLTNLLDLSLDIQDFIVTIDLIELLQESYINSYDLITVSENIVLSIELEILNVDNIQVSEEIIISTPLTDTLLINIIDNVNVSDNIISLIEWLDISISDNVFITDINYLSVGEFPPLNLSIEDYVFISDNIELLLEIDIFEISNIEVSENRVIELSSTNIDLYNIALVSTVSIIELVSDISIIDSVEISEFIQLNINTDDININIYDTIEITDNLEFFSSLEIFTYSNITITESIACGTPSGKELFFDLYINSKLGFILEINDYELEIDLIINSEIFTKLTDF